MKELDAILGFTADVATSRAPKCALENREVYEVILDLVLDSETRICKKMELLKTQIKRYSEQSIRERVEESELRSSIKINKIGRKQVVGAAFELNVAR